MFFTFGSGGATRSINLSLVQRIDIDEGDGTDNELDVQVTFYFVAPVDGTHTEGYTICPQPEVLERLKRVINCGD